MKSCITYGLCLILSATSSSVQGQPGLKRDSLYTALRSADSYSQQVAILDELSKWHLGHDYPQAVAFADSALTIANQSGEEALIATASTIRALVYWHNGEYDNSIAAYLKALALQEKLANVEEIGVNRHGIAMNYYYSADYMIALEHHDKALAAFRTTGNKSKEAMVLNHIGLIYHKMSNYPKAIEYLFESSKVQQELPGYSGRINSFAGVSPYHNLKDYWERELAKQLAIFEEQRNSGVGKNILELLYNIASIYKELGDTQKCLDYYRQAFDYSISVGRRPDYFALGTAYLNVSMVDSAISVHTKGIAQAKEKGTQINYMWGHQLLARDFLAVGKLDEALGYYEAGHAMTAKMGNKLDIAQSHQEIAQVYVAMKKPYEALARLQESIELAKRIRAKSVARDGMNQMAGIYASVGDLANAYRTQHEGKILADSITAGEADLQFAQLQVQFESDRKSEDIQRLSQEKQIQEGKIRNREILIFTSLLALVLSVLLAISTYRRYRLKIAANKILQQQKERIEILLAEIHHRVKNNLQVISSLLSIQSDQLKNKKARMAVLEGQSRVQVIGLIHENIYHSDNFAFIDLDDYLSKLVNTILKSFGFDNGKVNVQIHASGVSVDVDTAIPLGLITNELLTNCLKHAFKSVLNPSVQISVYLDHQGHLNVEVKDNGCGMPEKFSDDSFGLQLVRELSNQLGGTLLFEKGQGCNAIVRITKFKLAA